MPSVVRAQTNTFCASNLACTVSAAWTMAKINGVCYVDGTTNATLAAAVTCAGTNGIVDIPTFAVPALSANVTIPTGVTLFFEGSSPGIIQLGNFNLTVNGPIVAPAAQIFSYTGTGLVTLATPTTPILALWFSGADISAKSNNAFTACGQCTVLINEGTYNSVTTTLVYPTALTGNGTAGLRIESGAVINYTGTGDFLTATRQGGSFDNVYIAGSGKIIGTGSGTNGIHLKNLNVGYIGQINISGFTNGAGLLCDGANTVIYDRTITHGNKDGIREVGNATNNCNANKYKGGYIAFNTRYGVFEDASGSASANVGNEYSTTVEGNGTNGVGASGNVFIQKCTQCKIVSSYLEYDTGNTVANNLTIGDGSNQVSGLYVGGTTFGSLGATNSINDVNSTETLAIGNDELGVVTTYYNHGAASRRTTIIDNWADSATTVVGGSDGGADTLIIGGGPGVYATTFSNAQSFTGGQGVAFNQITGLAQDLQVWCRSGCTNEMIWRTSVGGTNAILDNTGKMRAALYTADQGSICTNGELALSAGWQSTGSATVTAVAGNGQTCSWTITTGTTTAANPTVTDTLTNVLPAATTVCEMNIHGGTHTAAAGEGFNQTALSATAPVFTFNGTPTAGGTTYFVTRRCGP